MSAYGSSAGRVVDCRRIMLKSVKYLDHWSISVCENLILSPFPIHSYSSIYLQTPKALSPPIFVRQPYPLQNYVILTAWRIFSIERNTLSRRIRATISAWRLHHPPCMKLEHTIHAIQNMVTRRSHMMRFGASTNSWRTVWFEYFGTSMQTQTLLGG